MALGVRKGGPFKGLGGVRGEGAKKRGKEEVQGAGTVGRQRVSEISQRTSSS